MKSALILALIFATPAWLATPLAAQDDDTIRVTTTLRGDGTRVDRKVDPAAHEITETVYGANDKIEQTTKYKTNANGDPTEGIAFDAKGKPILKVTYKRDANNHVTEQIESSPDDKLVRRIVYRYDGMGKLTGLDTYDANGNLLKKK